MKSSNGSRTSFPCDVTGALTGSGAFETCRVKAGKVLHLEAHFTRLQASLKTLGIFSWEPDEVREAVVKLARELGSGTVRVNVRRSGSERVLLHCSPEIPYDKRKLLTGCSVRTVPTRWPLGEKESAQVKGSERLASILGKLEGGDAQEVLRIGPDGFLTEGTVSNFFMIKRKVLMTSPRWVGVLEGITRNQVLRIGREQGMAVQEVPLTRHDLFNAEEMFLTNALMGIFPVREVDGRQIGAKVPGPITRRLMRILEEYDQ